MSIAAWRGSRSPIRVAQKHERNRIALVIEELLYKSSDPVAPVAPMTRAVFGVHTIKDTNKIHNLEWSSNLMQGEAF